MAQIIIAPSTEKPIYTSVFLAGGITNCKEWQKKVIEELDRCEKISIFNPRQEHFDITDKNAAYKQISWEFERLEQMDIFSMYFCNDSTQPICMYELGRNIIRMQNRFPADWERRIVISVEDGYERVKDVLVQTELATRGKIFVETDANPESHAEYIKGRIRHILYY